MIVKLVHSPHANALIENIDTEAAKAVDTIEAVYTYKDVPQKRFTMAGQTYPGPSPYDRSNLKIGELDSWVIQLRLL